MAITKEKKKELTDQFQKHKKDTGSPEVQVSILTEKINNLTSHLNLTPKDYQSQRGLLAMIDKRRRHLNYLEKNNSESYRKLVDELSIRS